MIVLIESHRQERAARRAGLAPTAAGARWGKAAEFGFDRTDAEAENDERGGINQVQRSQSRTKLWNLMLVPVGSETQLYVGGGIGYVEDPGDSGGEARTIHTFVLLSLPSPVPDVPVVASGEEGEWPIYPEEALPPGKFTPLAAVPEPWTR